MNDGYMGSGVVIQHAIEKYGIENFEKVVLEFFGTPEAMYAKEKDVVDEEFLAQDDVYNLMRGGFGGFDFINKHGFGNQQKHGTMGGNAHSHKIKTDQEYREYHSGLSSLRMQLRRAAGDSSVNIFTAEFNKEMNRRSTSESAKAKRKETFAKIGHQKGEKNSNFGTMWITNGTENKKVKKTDNIPDGWYRGRIIK